MPAFGRRRRGPVPVREPSRAREPAVPPGRCRRPRRGRAEAGIDELLATLDRELVGLAPVKTRVREIAALLLVDRTRARFGLTTVRPTLHMCFTGSPGTGKTTVALRMAEMLHRLGYLGTGTSSRSPATTWSGQYIGHTAPKTKEVDQAGDGRRAVHRRGLLPVRAENERDYGRRRSRSCCR